MLKAAYVWLSDWCSRRGYDKLSLRLLALSFKTRNLVTPKIFLKSSRAWRSQQFRPQVVFEDKTALVELGEPQQDGWVVNPEKNTDVN